MKTLVYLLKEDSEETGVRAAIYPLPYLEHPVYEEMLERERSMDIQTTEETKIIRADSAAMDKYERIFLLIKATNEVNKKWHLLEVISWLEDLKGIVPFALLVDREDIHIFKWNKENFSEPVCTLKTVQVLGPYGEYIDSKWADEYYLSGRVESWLRDLAFHWKSENPPAAEEMAAIGLLERMEGGMTQSEVEIRVETVH